MGQYNGIYRGVVMNVMDPQGAGRMQVQVPQIQGAGGSWAAACQGFGAPANSGPRVGYSTFASGGTA